MRNATVVAVTNEEHDDHTLRHVQYDRFLRGLPNTLEEPVERVGNGIAKHFLTRFFV